MELDKMFLIYQLLAFSEGDRLGLIDHNLYRTMVAKILRAMIPDSKEENDKDGQDE